jgi:hypothetical protein
VIDQLEVRAVKRVWRDPIARQHYADEIEIVREALGPHGLVAVAREQWWAHGVRHPGGMIFDCIRHLDGEPALALLEEMALGTYDDSVRENQEQLLRTSWVVQRRAALELGAMARRMGRLPESVWRFARSREVQPLHREYALRALGVYGSREARAYLVRVADDATEPDQIRTAARRALAMPTTASP